MKTRLALVLLAFFMVFCSASVAGATTIFMNFDPPNFTADSSSGADNPNHVYNTAYGPITFNGRIFNEFSHVLVPDHTTGSGNFLKNTGGPSGKDKITMNFSFDVMQFDFWLWGISGVALKGEAYDINGNVIDGSATWTGTGNWIHDSTGTFSAPVRSVSLWSTSGLGNNFAMDDLRITPIPEPASLSLLGLGLLGILGIRRKKK